MKKNIFKISFACFLMSFISFNAQKSVIQKIKSNPNAPFSYAELSVKEGGKWEGNFYKGGKFINVQKITIPAQHTDHSEYIRYEGIGLENNQIAYRLYLDWRNATDIFGKKINSLVLPDVGQDGFESYHHDAPWGQDILKSGRTLGIGSYGRFDEQNDFVETFKMVKNTQVEVKNESSFSYAKIKYNGWKTWEDAVDLESKLTIFNKDRFVKVDLTVSKEFSDLCTGIIIHPNTTFLQGISKNKKWAYIATYGKQTLTDKKDDNLGMAIIYPINQLKKVAQTKSSQVVVFKKTKNVSYYFLGAWSSEPNGISTEADFVKDLEQKIETLDITNQL